MRHPLTLLFALVALVISHAHAAPASQKTIQKMFSVMNMDQQFVGGLEAMMPIIDDMAKNLNLSPSETEELRQIYRDWYAEDIDQAAIMDKLMWIYADHFSEEEVQEIIAFYETPLGQKWVTESPKLMQLGAQVGMAEAEKNQAKLLERLEPFLGKHLNK